MKTGESKGVLSHLLVLIGRLGGPAKDALKATRHMNLGL